MLELQEKDIKMVIIIVFHMFKKLSKNVEDIWKYPNQTSSAENCSVWRKNTLSRTNGRLDIVREKISELEDIAVKTILNETPRTVNTWTECQWGTGQFQAA